MNYKEAIKKLQLDGTLNSIREDIDEHYEKEFNKRDKDSSYELQHIHFIDKLAEHMGVGEEDLERINLIHYQLSTDDTEFIKSAEEYREEKARLKKIKDDKYMEEMTERVIKATPEMKKKLCELFDEYKDIFD